MNKLRYLGMIVPALAPLMATSSQAQLDLFSPIEVMQEQHCLDHPELVNEPTCAKYYRRHPVRVRRSNMTTPGTRPRSTTAAPRSTSPSSLSLSPKLWKAIQECDNAYIAGTIAGARAANLSIPPGILRMARECGAI